MLIFDKLFLNILLEFSEFNSIINIIKGRR
jgi:hypothetical protein